MSRSKLPKSAWLADDYRLANRVVTYQEDTYAYDEAAGLYRRRERPWLDADVERHLIEAFGREEVDAPDVGRVGPSVRNQSYLSGGAQPPFWLPSQAPANVIVAANGVVQLDPLAAGGRPVLDPHTPALFATAGVPYPYDPAAECPEWLKTLRWMVGDRDAEGTVRLIQQFCAWALAGRRLKLESALWLTGPGGNGKSTVLRVVRHVLGDDATSAVGLEAFGGGGENFRLWPTIHKLANFATDAAVRPRTNVAGLNAFISGDPMTFNRKFREQLTIEPSVACFFASNQPPLFDDATDAWWRRLLLVRCDRRPGEHEVNPGLIDELKAEAPGILNWVLAAAPGLLRRRRFEVPAAVRENVAELKAQVNSARLFLAERVVGGGEQDHLVSAEVMGEYERWCKLNGYANEDLSVMKKEVQSAHGAEHGRHRVGPGSGEGRRRVPSWRGVRWAAGEAPGMAAGPLGVAIRQGERIAEQDVAIAEGHQEIEALRRRVRELEGGAAPPAPPRPARAARSATPEQALCVPGAPSDPTPEEIDALMRKLDEDPNECNPAGRGG